MAERSKSKPELSRELEILRKSELLMRSLAENTPDILAILNVDGTIRYINPAVEHLLGYKPDELIDTDGKGHVHPDDFIRIQALFASIAQSPAPENSTVEVRLQDKSGTWHWVEAASKFVTDETGESHVMISLRDITEHKQIEQKLSQRIEELAALQATALDLTTLPDLRILLQTIVERVMTLLNAPNGFIYLYNGDTDELELVVDIGAATFVGCRLKMGEGMAGQVAQTRKSLIIDDYSTWKDRATIYEGTSYRAVIEVPMLFGGQLIGVLGANETDDNTRQFTAADEKLLSIFAGQAANAVHTAQLLRGLQQELGERKNMEMVQAALYRISEAAQAARSLDELFPLIHAVVGELMPAQNFYIALLDTTSDLIYFPYYVDEFDAAPLPQKMGNGLTEYVLRIGKPLLATPEVYDQLEKSGEVQGAGTPSVDWLGVPLKTQGENTIGVMAVQIYSGPRRLDEADKDLLVFVSTQTAMAIERKRADDALAHSEAFSRSVIENEPECVKLLGPGGILMYMNPAGLAMIEIEDLQMVLGHSVYPIVAPEHREAFIKLTESVFRGQECSLQFEMIGSKGTRRWLDTRGSAL